MHLLKTITNIKTGMKNRKNSPLYRYWILSIFILPSICFGQNTPHDLPNFPFLKMEENYIKFPGDSSGFEKLYSKFDKVIFEGEGQVNLLHMGGSHVQAGVFSERMRTHFETIQPSLNSFRGFLFPFRMAATNNPSNYSVSYSGSWEYCRNVEKKKTCNLGLSGIMVKTNSPGASININFDQDPPEEPFTRLVVFQDTDSSSFEFTPMATYSHVDINQENGTVTYHFDSPQDSLSARIIKTNEKQDHFTLYGLKFESDLPGFAYNAVGINGASVPSYLRCQLLSKQSGALNLDLALFAIGINDAYGTKFSPSNFKANYRDLIAELRLENPEMQIIFITNNDSYYRRRYVNRNGLLVREAMIELAKEYNAGVWDLFEVMGGLESIKTWEEYGLAKSDKIHFTREGYELAGDLLFSAIVTSYENHLQQLKKNE